MITEVYITFFKFDNIAHIIIGLYSTGMQILSPLDRAFSEFFQKSHSYNNHYWNNHNLNKHIFKEINNKLLKTLEILQIFLIGTKKSRKEILILFNAT